ncbi:hypothetical protein B0T13DRAFT_508350 [Neurospora crassa]|nr:hypothetical protein B0T13DRAFT_508350 [Neurospora crassa]
MTDFGNNTPEGFELPEQTFSFDTRENHFLTPSNIGLASHNNAYTQTRYSSSDSVSGSGCESTSDTTVSATVTARRNKPIPRKGHTKSRRGCFTCKRRRVKCSEKLPECDNCTRIGLICEYPEPPNPSALSRLVTRSGTGQQARLAIPSPAMVLQHNPSSFSPIFTMEDLRFFHHFLIAAYPPLPVQAHSVWDNVAALSHGYDYLVHAMLGLAASHLSLVTSSPSSFCSSRSSGSQAALSHRVKSISLLNHSLSTPCSSPAEGDARFASILILAFQARCLPDGMIEFLSMIRLCSVIAGAGENSIFKDLAERGYLDSMRKMTAKTKAEELARKGFMLEPEQERLVDGFLASLGRLRVSILGTGGGGEDGEEEGVMGSGLGLGLGLSLVEEKQEKGRGLQMRILEGLEDAAKTTKVSPAEAFRELTSLYSPMNRASNADFASITDPANYRAQILLLHFFLMEHALGDLSLGAFRSRFGFRRKVCFAWLNEVTTRLPKTTGYAELIEWPLEFGQKFLVPREST